MNMKGKCCFKLNMFDICTVCVCGGGPVKYKNICKHLQSCPYMYCMCTVHYRIILYYRFNSWTIELDLNKVITLEILFILSDFLKKSFYLTGH